MPIAAPVAFPLFPINDGKCGCGKADCTRVGKHPQVAWGDLKYGDAVPLPIEGAGYGLKTGATPKGSGVFVVDLDNADAIERFAALGGLPDTYTVETPRGAHLYFQHPGFHVGNSVGALAKGIDIRGDGGFVVGPGSPHRSGGEYELLIDVDPAPAPPWLLDWLRARPAPAPVQPSAGDVTDPDELAYRSDLFIADCKTYPPSIEGKEGDRALFDICQRGAFDYALPLSVGLEAIREHFDPRCSPPWGNELDERVAHKWHDARTKSTRPRFEPPPRELASLFGKSPATSPKPQPVKSERLTVSERARRVGGAGLRLKTGLPSIDAATRGGLLLKKVVAIGGAPGAGKTATSVQIAFRWITAGIVVGVLCADEDADAILIRFGQLAGLSREALEAGDPAEREKLAAWADTVPFHLYDGDEDNTTIEIVSAELKTLACGRPSALFVDSIQTARTTEAPPKGADTRARTNVVVRALKAAAKVDGHLVVATSELAKAAYRNRDQADNVNPLSAFKESGDIEYGVGLAMVLMSRPGTSEIVDAAVVKNRLGHEKPIFLLRLDHKRAGVCETTEDAIASLDPHFALKAAIMRIIDRVGGPISKQHLYEQVGGRRQKTVDVVVDLIKAGRLLEDSRGGVRKPLPFEAGGSENLNPVPPP